MRVLPPLEEPEPYESLPDVTTGFQGRGAREGAEFDELALAYLESAGATITQRGGKLAGVSIDALVRGANGKVFCVLAHTLRQRARDWSWQTLSGGRQEAEWDVLELEPGPEELAEAADLARRVRGAIAGLPPGQRAAVVSFYLSGLSCRETATALGIGVPAAKARLHQGRSSLRGRLRPLWKEERMTVGEVVDMRVADVRRGVAEDDKPRSFLIILEEIDGERRLSIWTGEELGMDLVLSLEKVELFRPLTHHFLSKALSAVGGRVLEVRIDQLVERTFYATVVLDGPSGRAEVDARPSDALHLAVLAHAPIRAKAEVIDAARGSTEEVLNSLDEKFPEGRREIMEKARAAAPPAPSPADPS